MVFLPLFSTQDGREIYKKNITLQKILDCQFQLQNILHPKRSIWLVLILQVLITFIVEIMSGLTSAGGKGFISYPMSPH